MLKIAKGIILAIWALAIFNLIMPFPDPYLHLLHLLGIGLLVAHILEYFIFAKQIKKKDDTPLMRFINTMIYGLFYWKF